MARKPVTVKCRYCNKIIDRDLAFKVKKGKSNWYYCSAEHANTKPPRDLMYEQLNKIFGKIVTNTVLYKEFDGLANVYGYDKLNAYINENYEYLCTVMRKEFANDYNRIRYLSAIFKNNVGDFELPKPEIKKEVEVTVYEHKYKPKKQRRGLNDLMNDIIGNE